MVQVIVTFAAAVTRAQDGAAQVVNARERATEEMASSGTSGATTITAGQGDVAMVYNAGATPVWVKFGAAPVAAVGSGHVVGAGFEKSFGALAAGDKMAVIDDA